MNNQNIKSEKTEKLISNSKKIIDEFTTFCLYNDSHTALTLSTAILAHTMGLFFMEEEYEKILSEVNKVSLEKAKYTRKLLEDHFKNDR